MFLEPKKLEVLLICDYKDQTAATIIDHVKAFTEYSAHNIHILNSVGDLPPALDLSFFHVIVIHYSICISFDYFLSKEARLKLRKYCGLKVVYIQDDYRWIYRTLANIDYMQINIIFSLAKEEIIEKVYLPSLTPSVTRRETTLAGYVPPRLINLIKVDYEFRTIDVGYRARKLYAWVGEHSLQKWQIADKFLKDAPHYNLICNISCSEEDRIYGDAWFEFLSQCKSVLGTESGASLCDFTGKIQENVEAHVAKYPNATFEELKRLYFQEQDNKIIMNVISPRCFEAAALGTLMILYEGEYSKILKPYRHYVPLAIDHSNMSEVVEYIKSPSKAKEIINNAYNEVILNFDNQYPAMVRKFDEVINEEWNKTKKDINKCYTPSEFNLIIKANHNSVTVKHGNKSKFNFERYINVVIKYLIKSIYLILYYLSRIKATFLKATKIFSIVKRAITLVPKVYGKLKEAFSHCGFLLFIKVIFSSRKIKKKFFRVMKTSDLMKELKKSFHNNYTFLLKYNEKNQRLFIIINPHLHARVNCYPYSLPSCEGNNLNILKKARDMFVLFNDPYHIVHSEKITGVFSKYPVHLFIKRLFFILNLKTLN